MLAKRVGEGRGGAGGPIAQRRGVGELPPRFPEAWEGRGGRGPRPGGPSQCNQHPRGRRRRCEASRTARPSPCVNSRRSRAVGCARAACGAGSLARCDSASRGGGEAEARTCRRREGAATSHSSSLARRRRQPSGAAGRFHPRLRRGNSPRTKPRRSSGQGPRRTSTTGTDEDVNAVTEGTQLSRADLAVGCLRDDPDAFFGHTTDVLGEKGAIRTGHLGGGVHRVRSAAGGRRRRPREREDAAEAVVFVAVGAFLARSRPARRRVVSCVRDGPAPRRASFLDPARRPGRGSLSTRRRRSRGPRRARSASTAGRAGGAAARAGDFRAPRGALSFADRCPSPAATRTRSRGFTTN